MYRLFIVEDDNRIAKGISEQAKRWGFTTVLVNNFRNVMEEFVQVNPHLVLLDISLPYYNGYHWCSEIRKISKVPIIFISSASENMNIVMAMNMGADDFVIKPFDSNVLIAKVQAMLRRTYDFGQAAPVLEHKGVVLNLAETSLYYEGKSLELTKNEFKIVKTLMEQKNQVVSREKLMEALWESDCFVDENTLTVNIGRLRKKMEGIGVKGWIVTKFGMGYTLC